jgi:hypothetical protein
MSQPTAVSGVAMMVDIPSRVVFERKITTGNILTIVGGVFVAASILVAITLAYGRITSKVDDLTASVARLECALVSAGLFVTATQCSLPRRTELPHDIR